MKNPITVYLDASDYSDLSSDKVLKARPGLEQDREKLLEWVGTGKVRVQFSVVTVSEIAPVDVNSKPMAMARASFLNLVCKGCALADFNTIIFEELKSRALNCELDEERISNKAGDWLPSITFERSEFIQSVERSIHKRAASVGVSRKERKAKVGELFKNGKIQKKGKELLSTMKASDFPVLGSIFPVDDSEEMSNLFRNYLLGKVTEREFSEKLKARFFDVEHFFDCLFDHEGFDRTPKWLREIGADHREKLQRFRDKVEKLLELELELGGSEKSLAQKLRGITTESFTDNRVKYLEQKRRTLKKQLAGAGVSYKAWQKAMANCDIGSLPAFDCYGICIEQYMRDSIAQLNRPRSLRVSDYGDLLHSYYLPYVDIFRCDGYMARIFEKAGRKYNTTICGSLESMIRLLETRLNP